MEKSETITKISAALLKAQEEMGNASKGSTNPYFKSKYADLNAVREACIPVLNKHKISVLQPTVFEEGKPFVKTLLLHESGEYLASVTEIVFNKANDAQAHGSGVTYARRYGLQSFVNIGSEDDDGNAASQPQQHKEEPKDEKKWLNLWSDKTHKDFTKEGMNTIKKLSAGEITLEQVKQHYKLSKEVETYLLENAQNPLA